MEEQNTNQAQTPLTSPTPPKNDLKSKWPFLVIAGLLILVGAFGGYFVLNQTKQSQTSSPTQTSPSGPEARRVGGQTSPTPKPGLPLSSGLDKTYTSDEHNFQIDYPSKLKVETKAANQTIGPNGIGNSVYFSYVGPTQKEGTEFYDGIAMTIGVIKKAANDSIKVAADKITTPLDPDISTKTPLKEITINGLSGYEATVSGLGTFRNIILEDLNDSDRAYYFSIFADGPGDSKAEYEKIVEDMLTGFRSID